MNMFFENKIWLSILNTFGVRKKVSEQELYDLGSTVLIKLSTPEYLEYRKRALQNKIDSMIRLILRKNITLWNALEIINYVSTDSKSYNKMVGVFNTLIKDYLCNQQISPCIQRMILQKYNIFLDDDTRQELRLSFQTF